ncbi:MAG: hypothetical protein ACRCXN_12285 [Bacteroidales bacterium]
MEIHIIEVDNGKKYQVYAPCKHLVLGSHTSTSSDDCLYGLRDELSALTKAVNAKIKGIENTSKDCILFLTEAMWDKKRKEWDIVIRKRKYVYHGKAGMTHKVFDSNNKYLQFANYVPKTNVFKYIKTQRVYKAYFDKEPSKESVISQLNKMRNEN